MTTQLYNSEWIRCLDAAIDSDSSKLALQEFFGYLLCPHANYKKALVIVSKSQVMHADIIFEAATLLVGKDFTCYLDVEEMNDSRLLSILENKRLNLIEGSSFDQLSSSMFKSIISGEAIQVNNQYSGYRWITPIAKHIFIVYDKNWPIIEYATSNEYNRLMILDLNEIAVQDSHYHIRENLARGGTFFLDELEEIIRWAAEGLQRLINNNGKFTIRKAVVKMSKLQNIEFDLIKPSTNLMKLQLHRNNEDFEGIWISVSDETKVLLEKNTKGVKFIARLENDAIHFYPNQSWGLHLLCETNGENRPHCDLNWVDYNLDENRIWGEPLNVVEEVSN